MSGTQREILDRMMQNTEKIGTLEARMNGVPKLIELGIQKHYLDCDAVQLFRDLSAYLKLAKWLLAFAGITVAIDVIRNILLFAGIIH